MLDSSVNNYLSTAKGMPFFYVVGNSEYKATLDELKQIGVSVIHISDFCKKPDKFPNLDDMVDSFRMGDVDYKSNKFVVIGLGEYLALRGEVEALKVLRELKSTTLGIARVILLLRFVGTQVEEIAREDIRVKSRVYISSKSVDDTSIVNVKIDQGIGLAKKEGIQSLLRILEDGETGKLFVKTDLQLTNSMMSVESIDDYYSAVKALSQGFTLSKSLGEDEQWRRFSLDLQKTNYSTQKLFERAGFHLESENDFIEKALGYEYKNWLYFVFLKLNVNKLSNPYLRLVIDKTNNFKELKEQTLNALISVKHTEKNFKSLYNARKKLLKDVPESDIAIFINQNEIDPDESIYKLTDNTLLERQTIIRWVSEHGLVKEIEQIYPALFLYLQTYSFACGKNSDKLTEYFEKYKRQKIANRVEDGFEDYARQCSSLYAGLQTRANALMNLGDNKSTYLYWIDALGVEYLSYIQELAKKKGLSLHIEIARADLPTITGINRGFFDNWGENKYKESKLDDIKHHDVGGFDYRKCKLPIYLADELDVIEDAINRAATELAFHNYKKFIIASDHGASRLAVLGQHAEKYETDTKGEHSGRCCKYFDEYDTKNAVAENDYVILTDYGRFKGGREANVEVHGGCTLEETVIPIIALSLKTQAEVQIVVMKPEELIIDRKNGVEVSVYISDIENHNAVHMEIKGKSYIAAQTSKSHYQFLLDDIKRSGDYEASIFDGSNLIGRIKLHIKGAVGSSKTDFDDLF